MGSTGTFGFQAGLTRADLVEPWLLNVVRPQLIHIKHAKFCLLRIRECHATCAMFTNKNQKVNKHDHYLVSVLNVHINEIHITFSFHILLYV